MKKAWMMGSVVAVAGGLMLSAGCGTTRPPAQEPVSPVVMPPATPEVVAPAMPEVKAPEVKAPVAEVQTKTYVIKSGDSISYIAKRFKVPSKDIVKMNHITNVNKIRIGQKLTLPGYVDLNAPAPARKHHVAAKKTVKKAVKKPETKPAEQKAEAVAPVEGAAPAAGVAPAAEAAPEAAAPKSNDVLHVVEPNQTLEAIAMMYGVRAEEVLKLNNLSSPDVKVGQTLKIPPPAE